MLPYKHKYSMLGNSDGQAVMVKAKFLWKYLLNKVANEVIEMYFRYLDTLVLIEIHFLLPVPCIDGNYLNSLPLCTCCTTLPNINF